MSFLNKAFYDLLSSDTILTDMLALYDDAPAIFTIDPVPENADLPYIVIPGAVTQIPNDTKLSRGRSAIQDLRCYAAASGSSIEIDAIAERSRELLHRKALAIDGFSWLLSDVAGPIVANEPDIYGRILSVSVIAYESS